MRPTILVIYSAFNTEEYVRDSLMPFLNHPNCVIVASCKKFNLFPEEEYDGTRDILKSFLSRHTSFLGITDDTPVDREHEAKNAALSVAAKELQARKCSVPDYIMIVDSDEFYTEADIDKIVEFIEEEDSYVSFKIPLKNFIGDKNHYLKEPFCPPRVFRTSAFLDWTNPSGLFSLVNFYWDNDVCYMLKAHKDEKDIPVYRWDALPYCEVPDVWINHWSWMNDRRSENKIAYQKKHFGHCSFKWGESGVEVDEEYYKKHSLELPEIITL